MALDVQTISPYASQLLTLAELKQHLLVPADDNGQDDYITGLGIAATRWTEKVTGLCLGKNVRYRQCMDGFPRPREQDPRPVIWLMRGGVVSVESVKYLDVDGTETVLTSPDEYVLAMKSKRACLKPPRSTNAWPPALCEPEALVVEFTASVDLDGAGDPAPDPLAVQAVRLLAAHWFENREAGDVGRINQDVQSRLMTVLGPIRITQL